MQQSAGIGSVVGASPCSQPSRAAAPPAEAAPRHPRPLPAPSPAQRLLHRPPQRELSDKSHSSAPLTTQGRDPTLIARLQSMEPARHPWVSSLVARQRALTHPGARRPTCCCCFKGLCAVRFAALSIGRCWLCDCWWRRRSLVDGADPKVPSEAPKLPGNRVLPRASRRFLWRLRSMRVGVLGVSCRLLAGAAKINFLTDAGGRVAIFRLGECM